VIHVVVREARGEGTPRNRKKPRDTAQKKKEKKKQMGQGSVRKRVDLRGGASAGS